MTKKIYISTPIYYVNAKPHLGHAYTTIVADFLKRFYRSLDYDCRFITGTDEHGEKIAQSAEKLGVEPKAFCDEISGIFRSYWEKLGLEPNIFYRTTDPSHYSLVQKSLQRLYDKGEIYLAEYLSLIHI